jgi:hypothetical protein
MQGEDMGEGGFDFDAGGLIVFSNGKQLIKQSKRLYTFYNIKSETVFY